MINQIIEIGEHIKLKMNGNIRSKEFKNGNFRSWMVISSQND